MNGSQILGLLGTGLVAVAYVPQIKHLIKEHCSAGISVEAYSLWFAASALFLTHAMMIRDLVFIFVQVLNLVAISIVVIFATKYKEQLCLIHLEAHLNQLHQKDEPRP